jgi:hypothetical protein
VRIELPTGEYLREAAATFTEADGLFAILADWPAGGWTLSRVLAQISKSARQPTDAAFVGLVVVYCLADGTAVGVARCHFHDGVRTGFQVDYAAIHPGHRGAGHFTKFSDGLAYWANQILAADEGVYEVLDSAPQVLHRSVVLAGEAGASNGKSSEVRLAKQATAEVVRGKPIKVT